MDIKEIERLASQFRRGAEIAKDRDLFDKQPFLDFPNACCGDATELLAQYLLDYDKAIQCRYVYGVYRYDDFENIFGHAWLEVDGKIIVDITADQRQFRNERIFPASAAVPCYVGKKNAFYSLFEEDNRQCYRFYDLRCMPEVAYNRMKFLYDTIVSCMRV